MDLVFTPSCKSDTDICWSFTIYFKYDGSFKGAHSNFFRPGGYIGVSKYDGDGNKNDSILETTSARLF